jgi:hypothetical protein
VRRLSCGEVAVAVVLGGVTAGAPSRRVRGSRGRISAQDTVPSRFGSPPATTATTRPPSAPACGQAATWTPPPPSQAGSSPPRPARKEYQAPGS